MALNSRKTIHVNAELNSLFDAANSSSSLVKKSAARKIYGR
ncbi:MAG: hypothetical protein ABJK28_17615 [Algibacter sp.]